MLDKFFILLQDWEYIKQSLSILNNQINLLEEVDNLLNIEELSFIQKAYCALIAGFIGSLVGNPADLALVRIQADARLPLTERRNYKNVVDAFKRITKEEGFFALWRGAIPTVIRAMALNFAMLVSYD